MFYEEDSLFMVSRIVPVGPQFESREIVFRILPPGEFTGTLRDESGDAVPDSSVAVYRPARRGARIEWISSGNSSVNQRGRYRIAGLRPGDYTICALPPARRESYLVPIAEGAAVFVTAGGSRVYAKCRAGIHLESAEKRQMDLILPTSESVTVRSSPAALIRDDGLSLFNERQPKIVRSPAVRFEYPEIVPGRYVLEARLEDGGRGPVLVAHRRIVVSGEPVQDFAIHPEPAARLDVSTTRDDGTAAQKDDVTVEWLTGERPRAYRREQAPVFIVDPGVYFASFRARAPGCVVSAVLGGSDVLRAPATILPGMTARLDVVWSTQCGSVRVHGAVNDRAASFASWLLLVSGTPQEPGDALIGTLDADGEATIERLPPGRYRLWTWMNDAGGYAGPDLALAPFDSVEVTAGRTVSILVTAGGRR